MGESRRDARQGYSCECFGYGEEWFEWIERARYHVQDAPWAERSVALEERAELERRGLIAPLTGESFERAGAF